MTKYKGWPEEHTEMLRELAATALDNKVIAARMNEEFGTAYNKAGVAAKRHAMGLKSVKDMQPPAPPKRRKKKGGQAFWAQGKRTPGSMPKDADEGPHVAGLPLQLRERCRCAWPLDNDLPFLFCGMPVKEESPYCAFHKKRGTREGKLRPIRIPGGDGMRI